MAGYVRHRRLSHIISAVFFLSESINVRFFCWQWSHFLLFQNLFLFFFSLFSLGGLRMSNTNKLKALLWFPSDIKPHIHEDIWSSLLEIDFSSRLSYTQKAALNHLEASWVWLSKGESPPSVSLIKYILTGKGKKDRKSHVREIQFVSSSKAWLIIWMSLEVWYSWQT